MFIERDTLLYIVIGRKHCMNRRLRRSNCVFFKTEVFCCVHKHKNTKLFYTSVLSNVSFITCKH